MKKSEFIQKLINIETEKRKKEGRTTITMDYIDYLEQQKALIEIGDIELR